MQKTHSKNRIKSEPHYWSIHQIREGETSTIYRKQSSMRLVAMVYTRTIARFTTYESGKWKSIKTDQSTHDSQGFKNDSYKEEGS